MSKKITNKEFANSNKMFKDLCKKFGYDSTSRQASKFRNKKGIVYSLYKNK